MRFPLATTISSFRRGARRQARTFLDPARGVFYVSSLCTAQDGFVLRGILICEGVKEPSATHRCHPPVGLTPYRGQWLPVTVYLADPHRMLVRWNEV